MSSDIRYCFNACFLLRLHIDKNDICSNHENERVDIDKLWLLTPIFGVQILIESLSHKKAILNCMINPFSICYIK